MGKAFTDSWNLTCAGSKPVVSPGELLQATRGITEVKEAAPVPKKGTVKKSQKAAPQGGKGSVTSDNDKATPQTPESNNQPSAQPESSNPEVPKTRGAGEGSRAAVEAKPKRGKGRPTKREMRDETKLPVSREEFEAEMAQGEMTPEEREAEFNEGPQSPAAKPRVVKAALTDDERDLAERRASNMEDILFYNGIAKEDYDKLIDQGILTPKEIESGYMQNVPQMLSNISGDETQPGPLRHVAQMLLDLGFDFSKVRFRVAETADAQAEGGWAGLYRAGTSARSGEISINMDSDHKGGVAQSIVHEALHHVFFWKTQKGYPLNRVERAAFNDLQKIFKQAERIALRRHSRRGETIGQARARQTPGDLFYGLTNVDEFITEILTNPEFQVFLQQIQPMQSLPKKGGYIRNLLDQIFSYLRDFVYGRDVSGDSLLTQGLDNVLALIQTPQTESGGQRAMDQMFGEPVARATMPADESVNPEAPMSPAGDLKKTVAKLTGQEIITTPSGGTYEKGGLLSTDGKLDKRAGDRFRKRNMRIGAQERMVNMAVQKLVAAVKGERKAGREVSTDLMNTALGNLDNPLTPAQRAEVKALRANAAQAKGKQREALEQEANELEGAYMAKNREAFKVRQAQALAQLHPDVAEAISEMTQHITALSSALKAAGILEPGLGATIDANLGIYLHRSYEIFDDPKFKDAIRKNEKVMSDAQSLIRRQIESRNADKLIALAAEEGGILPRAEALKQSRGTAKQEEVDRVIEKLLAVGEESLGGVILKGRIPGQMDLSILDSRGNISPEIQALWGRYEDPTINYAKTALKITTLLENNAFLGDLRALGLKEGWLHQGDEDHPPGYLKISSDNNRSLAPIAGLYGNRDLVEALYAMYPPNGIAENYEWVRFFSKLTGVSMASKTVLSAAAHVRNFAGNFLNLAASGNLGINDILDGKRYKKALNLTIRSTFSNMSAQQFKDTIKELTELGVLNESLTSGLLKDLIGTKRVAGNALAFSDAITNKIMSKPAAFGNWIWDMAQKSYGSGDEFFKVVIYLSELEKYRKAMPEWSEQQLKENAAKIAREVHWTYSLSPVAVGKIKQFPFVAPFITFTTEVIRTTRNTMALAYNEIKEGNRTGNKELAAIGWKRVRGMSIAAFAPSVAAGAMAAMAGISGEDDDDLRRFLPDWQKNSQLLVFKNSDGKVSFIDVSYLDPYEYWKRPVTAFLRALAAPDDSSAMERITEGAVQAGAQLINPFASEQILSGALLDLARNQKQNGQEVWNPEDTGMRVAAKVGDHLWNAFEPGTLTSGGRVLDAALGNVSDSGRSFGLFNELASVGLGQRISELDVTQALGFKTSQANRALRDASSLFTREFSSKGTRSEEEIMDAYARANDATFEITKAFREDVDAAMRLSGMSAKQMKEILAAGGMGKEKIKMVQTGRFTRYTPSEQQIKLAKSLGNQDRIQAARQAESGVPRTAELR
jgi:hypothetical protein